MICVHPSSDFWFLVLMRFPFSSKDVEENLVAHVSIGIKRIWKRDTLISGNVCLSINLGIVYWVHESGSTSNIKHCSNLFLFGFSFLF